MSKNFYYVVAAIGLLYFIKKGLDDARKNGENLSFFESIVRGFELTNNSKPKDQQSQENTSLYVNSVPTNQEMVSFTREFNSFQGAALKKQRGLFNKTVINSYNGN